MHRSRATHYFRRWSATDDPEQLLEPQNQWSTPWGAADHGPCEKCEGRGTVLHRCLSCLERAADPTCPACAGRVEFRDVCPSCEGDGTIDRTRRRGVSVFPAIDGLYRYIAETRCRGGGLRRRARRRAHRRSRPGRRRRRRPHPSHAHRRTSAVRPRARARSANETLSVEPERDARHGDRAPVREDLHRFRCRRPRSQRFS
jgi:hypothetical protein